VSQHPREAGGVPLNVPAPNLAASPAMTTSDHTGPSSSVAPYRVHPFFSSLGPPHVAGKQAFVPLLLRPNVEKANMVASKTVSNPSLPSTSSSSPSSSAGALKTGSGAERYWKRPRAEVAGILPAAGLIPSAGVRQQVLWTNLRVQEMSIGGSRYSSKIYGDKMDDKNFVVRGTKKRRDKNMMLALERRIPVLVTINDSILPRFPKVIGVGMVESVEDTPEGLREFRIKFRTNVEAFRQDRRYIHKSPNKPQRCWIKREFLQHIGMTCIGNLMQCSVMCDLVGRFAPVQKPARASE